TEPGRTTERKMNRTINVFNREAQPIAITKPGDRSGTALIEILVVITVAAAMTGLAVTTIHLLLTAEHEATKTVRFAASVARLTKIFREDVHAAVAVELQSSEPGMPAVLIVTADSRRQVRYELDGHLATRIETVAGAEQHRDAFYFPVHSRLRFE